MAERARGPGQPEASAENIRIDIFRVLFREDKLGSESLSGGGSSGSAWKSGILGSDKLNI